MEKNSKDLEIRRLRLKLERERQHRRHLEDQHELNKSLLQSAKEEIEKLVFQVTHDLRSPISSLGQIVEEILPQLPLDRKNVFLSSIARVQDISNEVLQRHKVSDPMIQINKTKKAVDLISLVKSIVDEKKIQYKSSNEVSFTLSLVGFNEDEKAFANMREVELTCILYNTLENSIEAIREKNIDDGVISLTVEKMSSDYKIIVNDNGIGIEEEKIKDLGKYGVTLKKNGNGLGLYSSIHYLNKRGGDLKIQSIKGEGTTVTISIPVSDLSKKGIKIDPDATLVIVDDDVLIHESIRLLLEDTDFRGDIVDFYTEEEFRSWHHLFGTSSEINTFHIIDGFINSHYPNGPKIACELGLIDNSIIYTGKRNLMPADSDALKVFDKSVLLSDIITFQSN